uniref:Uncharacterized protein n=1 Tax=Anguilla anguilla TaxID=7936 RepID=A0A0E9RF92_ANGAN
MSVFGEKYIFLLQREMCKLNGFSEPYSTFAIAAMFGIAVCSQLCCPLHK